MKINFNTVLKDITTGEAMLSGETPLTARKIAVDALLATFPGEETMEGTKKVELFSLAVKVSGSGDECTLTVDEVAQIKDRVGRGYSPMVVGQVWPLLEGN